DDIDDLELSDVELENDIDDLELSDVELEDDIDDLELSDVELEEDLELSDVELEEDLENLDEDLEDLNEMENESNVIKSKGGSKRSGSNIIAKFNEDQNITKQKHFNYNDGIPMIKIRLTSQDNTFAKINSPSLPSNMPNDTKKIGGDHTEEEVIGQKISEFVPDLLKQLQKKDPYLFKNEAKKSAKSIEYDTYSRKCPSYRQPTLLSKEEFEKYQTENPSYVKEYLEYKYTHDNEIKTHYIVCPHYWCILKNTFMTEEDVKMGKCSGKGKPDEIVKMNENNRIEKGKYVFDLRRGKKPYPFVGVLDKNKNGFQLPCCYSKPHNKLENNLYEKKKDEQPTFFSKKS
ncbi:MAG: hypothetical protein EBS86_17840, partial [Crocinitomicaceae bacterium]|nr:hypothetical protein [Crocinitomicaceae bacterium]